MTCEVWTPDETAMDEHAQAVEGDSGLRELIDEVARSTGQIYSLTRRDSTERVGWFRTRPVRRYDLLFRTRPHTYQVINFGPPEMGGASFGWLVNRQAVAGYLFGVLNGWRGRDGEFQRKEGKE